MPLESEAIDTVLTHGFVRMTNNLIEDFGRMLKKILKKIEYIHKTYQTFFIA